MSEARFAEATVVYHSAGADPREPADRSERRLINLADVVVVTPTGRGDGRAVLHMRHGTPGSLFVTLEPYEYWASILTAWQPREP